MKKTRSLFALLILGSMVLAGCGKDKNDSIPGGTDTPSQPSGSGDGGSGSGGSGDGGSGGGGDQGGGGQQGGGGEQGGGGQQGGGGEGGGGGEVPATSQFVNKKFLFHSVSYPSNATIEAALNQNYQGAHASFFQNGKFELVSVVNSFTMAYLGDFTVAQDDSYATLDVRKEYDGESQAYGYLESGTFVTSIRFNEGQQKYVIPMRQYIQELHGTINFDAYLTLSNELPEAADLPTDPNGDNFDPAHQVYKDVWDRLIVGRGLLHASTSNYKVTSGSTIFEVDGGTKFYEHYTTGSQGSGMFWERTSIEGSSYNYTNTIISNGAVYSSSPVEYGVDFFDSSVGLAPIPFNWMTYNSVGQYYYRSSYTYQNSFYGSVTVNEYRVYFSANYRVSKITYEDNAHQTFEFNFSDYGLIDLNLDDLTNGGSGGGGGQQQNDEPTDYYQYVQNKTMSYNRVSNTGDLSSEELQNAAAANANIAVGVFNDLSIEMQWPDHFYYDGENCSMSVLMYGSLQFSSFGTLSGRRVARGSVTITGLFINGADESGSPHEMTAMWDIENNQFVIKMDDPSNGDQYYLFLDTSNTAPTHIPQPEPPQSQLASFKLLGINDDWDVGISGEDATDPDEVALGDYLEQRRFTFTALANDEIKLYDGNTYLGYDTLEEGCKALATKVTEGLGYDNIKLNEGGNYTLYLKLKENTVYKIWLSKESGGEPHPVSWPTQYISDALAALGVANDVVPACDLDGVTGITCSPNSVADITDIFGITLSNGAGKYASYKTVLDDAGYSDPLDMDIFSSANQEISIFLSVSGSDLSIVVQKYVAMPSGFPCIVHSTDGGLNVSYDSMQYDDWNDEYSATITLVANEEFYIMIDDSTVKTFEDYIDNRSANGAIAMGTEMGEGSGMHTLLANEAGEYSIYVNSIGEVYIVHGDVENITYRFNCQNDWDITEYSAVFYVWVWDYYNDNEHWIELTPPQGSLGSYYFEVEIPYNMVGAKIVRMDPSFGGPDWSAEWDGSDDLELSGIPGEINFSFL